jgi:hypothetical protein
MEGGSAARREHHAWLLCTIFLPIFNAIVPLYPRYQRHKKVPSMKI